MAIQSYITELTQSGKNRTGKGLTANFVNGIITVMKSSLKTAHTLGYAKECIASKVKCPKAKEKQVNCFTIPEQKKIEAAALSAKRGKYKGVALCLYTGLRIGELTWKDAFFEE